MICTSFWVGGKLVKRTWAFREDKVVAMDDGKSCHWCGQLLRYHVESCTVKMQEDWELNDCEAHSAHHKGREL